MTPTERAVFDAALVLVDARRAAVAVFLPDSGRVTVNAAALGIAARYNAAGEALERAVDEHRRNS